MGRSRVTRRMGSSVTLVLLLLLVLGLSAEVANAAAPGTLDPTFGVNGVALTSFGPGITKACAMAIQPDGKYVVAGTYQAVAGIPPVYATLARYNADGSLDVSFGSAGKVQTDFSTAFAFTSVDDVALMPDGKIVVSFAGRPQLARYLASGSLDTSFGTNGLLSLSVAPWTTSDSTTPCVLTAQPDGKLLVGMTLQTSRNDDFAVFRLNPDGSPDVGFGAGGSTTIDIAGASQDDLSCLALAPDNGIFVGGSCQYSVAALVRLTPGGALDTTFGSGGKVVAEDKRAVVGVVAQPDGSVVTLDGGAHLPVYMARYAQNGALDTTFGVSGWVDVLNLSGLIPPNWVYGHAVSQIARQPDGSLVLAGTFDSGYPTFNDIWVSRFTFAGALDTGFGTNGVTVTDLGGADDCAAAAIGPDGKFVVAGYALPSGSPAVGALWGGPPTRAVTAASEGLARYDTGPSLLVKGPRTYALVKVTGKKGAMLGFHYRANALTKKVTVTIKIFKGSKLQATVAAGFVRASVVQVKRWRCSLSKGSYVWKVYAVDQNRKKQTSIGSNKLIVT